MRSFDFSSWQSVLTTLIGIAIFALVGIGTASCSWSRCSSGGNG